MQQCFQKWKQGYERNMEREDQLQRYLSRKNWHLMGQYMDTWRTTLMGNQAKRLYEMKLKATIFSEWHLCASGRYRMKSLYEVNIIASLELISDTVA